MAPCRWYLARNRERVGPFSGSDLKQLAIHGLLEPTEYVWAEGASKWVQAASLAGLFPAASEKKYWISMDGQTRGPYVAEQIHAGITAGKLDMQTPVRPDGTAEWLPLGNLAGFRGFVPPRASLSQAKLLAGTLELEEAGLHIAGKTGDSLARLMSTLMDLKRDHAENPAVVETLEKSIQILRSKRELVAQGQ